jgi:hypothetical protein
MKPRRQSTVEMTMKQAFFFFILLIEKLTQKKFMAGSFAGAAASESVSEVYKGNFKIENFFFLKHNGINLLNC